MREERPKSNVATSAGGTMVGQTGLYSCPWCCGDLHQVGSEPEVSRCEHCGRTVTFSGPERSLLVRCDPVVCRALLEAISQVAGRGEIPAA